ncbi:hypothetical protein RRG08_014749 [Elysia crispata]|uniref:Uncharacterized protein n=1 Tax=Elysia crispata TaxID=231223 RepID=A0AAE1ATV3_9GAST|nr:hypothetical protein RRG08_014749 [Elysia crispata]
MKSSAKRGIKIEVNIEDEIGKAEKCTESEGNKEADKQRNVQRRTRSGAPRQYVSPPVSGVFVMSGSHSTNHVVVVSTSSLYDTSSSVDLWRSVSPEPNARRFICGGELGVGDARRLSCNLWVPVFH